MLAQNPDNNFVIANPNFRSVEQSDWNLRPDAGSILTSPIWELSPSDGFFDQSARCAGAFCGEEDWTEEWTNKLRESDLILQ